MDLTVESVIRIEGLFLAGLGLLAGISLVNLFVQMYRATGSWLDTDERVNEAGRATGLALQKALGQIRWSVFVFVALLLFAAPLLAWGGKVMWVTVGLLALVVLGRFSLPLLVIGILKNLANANRGFTIVDEATAKIIVRGGGYARTFIQWAGYTLNEGGDVILEDNTHKEPHHPFGGLRRYGRPVAEVLEVLNYTFRSATLDESGEVQRRSTQIDYVSLADRVYWCEIEGVDILRVPLRLELVLTAHVKNPRKALFAVADWLNAIITRTQAEARNVMTQKGYDDWIKNPQAVGDQIFAKFGEGTPNILEDEFEERYGVVLRDIGVRKIEVTDPSYRETTLQQDKAEREKRAFEIKADLPAIEAGMRAINMLAQSRGIAPEAISVKLAADGDNEDKELRKEALELMTRIHHDKMAMDAKSYMEVNIPGGNLESGLAALLAVFKRIPTSV